MKTEKQILSEFVRLVFRSDESNDNEILSTKHLLKSSLSSIRLVAKDALEISSHLKKSEQDKLNSKLIAAGLPSLASIQDKAFRGFLKIVNRGNIKKDSEFYLVKSVLESNLLNQEHQEVAFKLVESYE